MAQPLTQRRGSEDVVPPSVVDARLYRPIESLCRDALTYAGNAAGMRATIISLVGAMRRQAFEQYGHDTADVVGISDLLKRTDPIVATRTKPDRKPDLDPIHELQRQAHLRPDQVRAADLIGRVWKAWGRYLSVAAKTYEKRSQARREKALDPYWAMGESDHILWLNYYRPWYDLAKAKPVAGDITAARIVLHVITVPMFPGRLDFCDRLDPGTSLRVLKEELSVLARMSDGVIV